MIKNIYYTIWIDCILQLRKQPFNKDSWKWKSMMIISLAMSLNFMLIIALLGLVFDFPKNYVVQINIFAGSILDSLLSFMILYGLPVVLFNYFMIFYKDKYEILRKKYAFFHGRYFLVYFFLSLGIPFILMLLVLFIQN